MCRAGTKEENMEKKTGEYYRREVKSFIKEFLHMLMLEDRQEHLAAHPDDKGNGFYDRDLTTSIGHLDDLKVPRTRSGEFSPAVLPSRRRASFDLEELVFAMHVGGSSTRDISRFIERVYSASLGRDAISRLTDVAQGVIDKWKNRPLEKHYTAIFLDATFVKLRRGDVRSEPVYVAIGVLPNGDRQILGFTIFGSEGESAASWHEYLRKLKERGVKTVDLFITDNLSGLTETIGRVFPDAQHQLCVVHQVRNCLRDTRSKDKAELATDMKSIYRADNVITARENFDTFKKKWQQRNPKAVHRWELNLANLLTFMNFPAGLRRYIYTTNMLERLNKEIKRRIKVIESFSNEHSLEKMLYLILREEDEKLSKRKMPNVGI